MQYRRSFTRSMRTLKVTSRAAIVGATVGGAVLCLGAPASAQVSGEQFPFPSSNAQTGNGRFTTAVLTAAEIQAQYNTWKQNFIRTCPNNQLRVRYPESEGTPDDTRSEGIGYGMVIAAYMGDLPTFRGLRNYYFGHLDGSGLMNWYYLSDCNTLGPGGQGSAADADIDAAFALIVANDQWPGEGFGTDATTLLQRIRTALFDTGQQCPGILFAGSMFRGCGCINPSYIPPGYYRSYAATEAAQAAFWNTARANSLDYFERASNPATGLVPAWSRSDGNTAIQCPGQPQVSGGGATGEFQADAARTPWRVATDYLWTGDADAASFLRDIAEFATTQRIVHIVDRYRLDGTPLQQARDGNGPLNPATLDADGRRTSFTMGGFASAMMARSQADLDAFTGAWQSMYLPGDNFGQPRAFGSSLAILYGLLVTGYMWDPLGPNPTRVTPPALAPQGTNALENGDFDEGFLGWTMENIGGVASEGYAMHLDGEMHLRNQRVAGAPDQWHLRLSQTVAVQAGQRYRISVRARAAEPRLVRLLVAQVNEPYRTYLALDDSPDVEGAAFTVDTEMRTYEIVGQAALSDTNARFAFELADDLAELIIDDVVFEPTDEPVRGLVPGGTPDPGDPTNPTDPTNPDPGTGGPGPVGNNGGPVIPNQGDNTNGGGPVGGPLPGDQTGGLPPPPAGRPTGNGTCVQDNDGLCGQFQCSEPIGLCFEPTYGYVWDASLNGGQGGWAQPPSHNCGSQFVFWPLSNACYDPETGYIFNPNTNQWQYFGDWYTEGQDNAGADDSGCAVIPGASSTTSVGLWGTLLAAAGVGLRQRRRAKNARDAR